MCIFECPGLGLSHFPKNIDIALPATWGAFQRVVGQRPLVVMILAHHMPCTQIPDNSPLSPLSMPTSHPPLPPPPEPTRVFFDPFNSSSTGHQRAENRLSGSTSWRDSRTYKLAHQLRDQSGRGGGQHLSDLVGAGSENFGKDGRLENGDWAPGAPGLQERGWRDIREVMGAKESKRDSDSSSAGNEEEQSDKRLKRDGSVSGNGLKYWQGKLSTDKTLISTQDFNPALKVKLPPPSTPTESATASPYTPHTPPKPPPPQIFAGLTIYLNGSTAPLLSDHKLKQLLAQHGANVSIALGRKTVTHVILGETGGLAAGKVQKEVVRTGGRAVKFVCARWVLDSIEKGKRQSEAKYQPLSLAMKGQRSVLGAFVKSGAGIDGQERLTTRGAG